LDHADGVLERVGDDGLRAAARARRGVLALERGDVAAAIAALTAAVTHDEQAHGPNGILAAKARIALGVALVRGSRHAEARAALDRAVAALTAARPGHAALGDAWNATAMLETAAG